MTKNLYNQIMSIKKTRVKILPTLKTNKKFRFFFTTYFLNMFLLIFVLIYFGLKHSDQVIPISIITLILSGIQFFLLSSPSIKTIANETSLKRKKELEKLMNLFNITKAEEINKLQNIIEHWSSQSKPEKFNWAIILVFYSVLYTSFVNHLMIELFTNFKIEYVFILLITAILFHAFFYFIKSVVEFLFFSRTDSDYRFLLWVSSELKKAELEAFLLDNKKL